MYSEIEAIRRLTNTGNTFGGTALSSYGGFWIGTAILLIPGGFEVAESYGGEGPDFYTAFGLYVRLPHPSTSNHILTKPDLRLVHLHIPTLAPHAPLNCCFHEPFLNGLAGLHLPWKRVPGC